MGISESINKISAQFQTGVKASSLGFLSFALKLVTGFTIGLTFALVGQEAMGYETLSFVLVLVTAMSLIFKIIAKWTLGAVILFDLFCVLVALLLRMYILLAP